MCRLFGFRSSVLSQVHTSLVNAENALLKQSIKHPDGWGIAYYNAGYPHLICSEKQALEDRLFKELSSLLSTQTLVAHIRKATFGKASVLNSHPFQHGPWVFAHNGNIANFGDDKDLTFKLKESIYPYFRTHILGETDSEICFYLFLSILSKYVSNIYDKNLSVDYVIDSIQETMDIILEICHEYDEKEINRLTFLLSNGSIMFANCYKRTLYFSTHKTRCLEREFCSFYKDTICESPVESGVIRHMLLSSELILDNPNVWIEMNMGEYVCVDSQMNFRKGNLNFH